MTSASRFVEVTEETRFLFLLSQSTNNGYDTFDAIVVCASNEEEALGIVPISGQFVGYWNDKGEPCWSLPDGEHVVDCWARTRDDVECRLLGIAEDGVEPGIVLRSFRPG